MNQSSVGVLLIQLGTPDAPTPKAVKRYLAEFLGDKHVVDLPAMVRQILLHGVILRVRPKQSAKAYAEIWDKERGSPLRYHTEDLVTALQAELGTDYQVRYAMRYGGPSIKAVLSDLSARVSRVVILPLFPQYADATTGSVMQQVYQTLATLPQPPALQIEKHFYAESGFITAYAKRLSAAMAQSPWDKIIMSFHSLPVRQLKKAPSICASTCFKSDPCAPIQASNAACYRAQCYETARRIAGACKLRETDYQVVFQSRLGRIPWIGPELNQSLKQCHIEGAQRILVACPSFVTDCLETLEEIGIRAQDTWHQLGGEALTLVPCLNADPDWVGALGHWLKESTPSPAYC